MVAVPDATAALETHPTVTKVVEQALHLLQNLAHADANRVRPWCDAPTARGLARWRPTSLCNSPGIRY
jgi:hypothetical protein